MCLFKDNPVYVIETSDEFVTFITKSGLCRRIANKLFSSMAEMVRRTRTDRSRCPSVLESSPSRMTAFANAASAGRGAARHLGSLTRFPRRAAPGARHGLYTGRVELSRRVAGGVDNVRRRIPRKRT